MYANRATLTFLSLALAGLPACGNDGPNPSPPDASSVDATPRPDGPAAIDAGEPIDAEPIDAGLPSFNLLDKLRPSDGKANAEFGNDLAIDGDRLLVGAPSDSNQGAAYVFEDADANMTWEEEDKLVAATPTAQDLFGFDVDIDGTRAVIGAGGDDTQFDASGAAYIFERSDAGWDGGRKLTAETGATQASFGRSVGLFGDLMIAASSIDGTAGAPTGAVYTFQKLATQWIELGRDTPAAMTGDELESIYIDGALMAVGMNEIDRGGADTGSVYVFRRGNDMWTQVDHLQPDPTDTNDNFGHDSIVLAGDLLVVGAKSDDTVASNAGAAYVFEKVTGEDRWAQVAKLTADDGAADDAFGQAVAAGAGLVVVGAPNHGGQGAVYVFARQGGAWGQVKKLTALDGASGDRYGWSLALGAVLAVGAPYETQNGSRSGAVYLYLLD
ncbi:hypothetical protein [Haliangium sp.]|uniref:hypothetical protein n=1 Tax=Haliangium sp. TaxID=2663208 RepID=UPI003D0B1176